MTAVEGATFQHQGSIFCDRAGVPLTRGMSVRVQHSVGGHGLTELAYGTIEEVDVHGIQIALHRSLRRVGRDGGVRYLRPGDSVFLAVRFTHEPGRLVATHEHGDVEHGHQTFVESLDQAVSELLREEAASQRIQLSGAYLFGIEAALKGLRGCLVQRADGAEVRTMSDEVMTRLIHKYPAEGERKLVADGAAIYAIEQGLMNVCDATCHGAPSGAVVELVDRVLDDLRALAASTEQAHGYLCVVLNTNSAAFDDVGHEAEVARLLNEVADAFECSQGERFRRVLEDTNGRVVGIAAWSEKPPVAAAKEEGAIRLALPVHPDRHITAEHLRAWGARREAQQSYDSELHSPEPN